eukprot:351161-Chlamydomonas_euryale.AAC.2
MGDDVGLREREIKRDYSSREREREALQAQSPLVCPNRAEPHTSGSRERERERVRERCIILDSCGARTAIVELEALGA